VLRLILGEETVDESLVDPPVHTDRAAIEIGAVTDKGAVEDSVEIEAVYGTSGPCGDISGE
jgi:hypothetical protein